MFTIHSLTLTNVAAIDHATLRPAESGVTVIYGPNEVGKSTFVKALQLLFNPKLRASSEAAPVKELRPLGRPDTPQISGDFTIGPYRLLITKDYAGKSGSATLTISAPERASLSGKQAEDRFADICDEHLDRTMFDAMVVTQGSSLDPTSVAQLHQVASSLHQATEQGTTPSAEDTPASSLKVLDEVGDTSAAAIFDAAAQLYHEYFTKTDRENTHGKGLAERVRTTEEARAKAEANLAAVNATVEDIARKESEIDRQQRSLADKDAALHRAETELAAAEEREHSISDLRNRASAAEAARSAADKDRQARAALRSDVDELRSSLDRITTELDRTRTLHSDAESTATATRSRAALLSTFRSLADADIAFRDALTRRDRLREELAEVRHTANTLRTLEDEARTLRERRSPRPMTAARLEDLTAATAAFRQAISLRDQRSVRVRITAPDGTEETHLLSTERTLRIGEHSVTITPPLADGDSNAAVTSAFDTLRGLIDAWLPADSPTSDPTDSPTSDPTDSTTSGAALRAHLTSVDTLSDAAIAEILSHAQRDFDAATDLERSIRALEERRAEALGGRRDSDIHRRIEDLESEEREATERLRLSLAAVAEASSRIALDSEDLATLDGGEDMATHASTLSAPTLEAEDTLSAEELAARTSASHVLLDLLANAATEDPAAAEARVRTLSEQLYRLDGSATQQRQSLSTAEAKLATARESTSDEALEEAYSRSVDDALSLARTLEQQQAAVNLSLDAAREERDRAQSVVTTTQAAIRSEERALERLRGELAAHGPVVDELTAAEQDYREALRARTQWERRAHAARRLYQVLSTHRQAERSRYAQPFLDNLLPLAEAVFGAEGMSLNDDLEVTARTRGTTTVPVKLLSGGTTEQLNLIIRLAAARLVSSDGEPTPIIFDDVLGFADEERAQNFNKVLGAAGKNLQVIIFTCDSDRFAGIRDAKQLAFTDLTALED